jgi:CDGSH-type Zn-finger protein/uncharacterized Fe-S cluster protein YjdI
MKERVSTYTGERIEITYDRSKCIHAAECGRSGVGLFDVSKDPWCDPDAVDAEVAAEVVGRCPSGALKYRRLDGGPSESHPDRNRVAVQPSGPLYASGNIVLKHAGQEVRESRVALCRCGHSKNKPFCDNAHKKAEFKDAGPVASAPEPIDLEPGPVTIEAYPNGPYVAAGPVHLHAASGREAFRGTKTALCRCGGSQNKPFCDGTHRKIGFEAP